MRTIAAEEGLDLTDAMRKSSSVSPVPIEQIVSARQRLADEIYALRLVLEQVSMSELSLSSDQVVELSGRLDRKINEYMKLE